MTTEIIRDTDRLVIRWELESGEPVSIVKYFDANRQMHPAVVRIFSKTKMRSYVASELRVRERELHYASALAEEMDHIFLNPVDFDRVTIDDQPPLGGYPAAIFPREDGRIYIQRGNL